MYGPWPMGAALVRSNEGYVSFEGAMKAAWGQQRLLGRLGDYAD